MSHKRFESNVTLVLLSHAPVLGGDDECFFSAVLQQLDCIMQTIILLLVT